MQRSWVILGLLTLILPLAGCSDDAASGAPVGEEGGSALETGDTGGEGSIGGIKVDDFGEACVENSECESGFCVEGPTGFICTQTCLDTCPEGFSCKAVANTFPDVIFLCMPQVLNHCAPCQEDFQCPGGLCREMVDGTFCIAPCTSDDECPGTHACTSMGMEFDYCIPTNGSCSCRSDTAGLERTCEAGNELGTCLGFETCDAELGWVDCSAEEPLNEICDYQDNDCDGLVDEDFLYEGKYASFEHCGGCNIDCGNGMPNATAICNESMETPTCVVQFCDPGYAKLNDYQCIPTTVGLCEPCESDEQCLLDGSLCAEVGDASYCLSPCLDNNDCPDGFDCLTMEGGTSQCMPSTGSCNCSPETPGLVKSCSETSSPPGAPVTTCYGIQSCLNTGEWGECTVPEETCDGLDNNCDGAIDEGFLNEEGQYSTLENCGQCGNNCSFLSFAQASPLCDASLAIPTCAMNCDPGMFDVNGITDDGCECVFQSNVDLPDSIAMDSNCDGIDGELTNGVFVAKYGDDSLPGTLLSPVRTLQTAIDRALAEGKRDVYAATGVYIGSIQLIAGVQVHGGYSGDFHQRSPLIYETVIFGGASSTSAPGAVNAQNIAGGEDATLSGFTIFGTEAVETGSSSYGIHLLNCDQSVNISENIIYAGNGSDGERGNDGQDGIDGQDGTIGSDAIDGYATPCFGVNPGGDGGATSCGGASVNGGSGGIATCPDYDQSGSPQPKSSDGVYEQSMTIEHGEDGAGPAPGAGGDAGFDSLFWSSESGCGICRTPKSSWDSLFLQGAGTDGWDGDDGAMGASGSGCTSSGTVLNGSLWTSNTGNTGGTALHGSGGGGGGAGGGTETVNCPQYNDSDYGGGGGGGGSGACSGIGASGGTGGGGSFGVFVSYTSNPGSAPLLQGNTIHTGKGGHGGDGGSGGSGGVGGKGKSGGNPGDETPDAWCAELGGNGGNGGNGGHGGGGGGGCGGPSHGVFLHGQGGVDVSEYNGSNLFDLSNGFAGNGGLGGPSIGNPGGGGISGTHSAMSF
jgi:hypothetical protein